MKAAALHRFSTVTARGKRRIVDGEMLIDSYAVMNGRVIATNAKGNILIDCSHALWDNLISKGYLIFVEE